MIVPQLYLETERPTAIDGLVEWLSFGGGFLWSSETVPGDRARPSGSYMGPSHPAVFFLVYVVVAGRSLASATR